MPGIALQRKRWAPGPNAEVNWSHPLAANLEFVSSGLASIHPAPFTKNTCPPQATSYGRGASFASTSYYQGWEDQQAGLTRMYQGSGYSLAFVGTSSPGTGFLLGMCSDGAAVPGAEDGNSSVRLWQLRYYNGNADFIPFNDLNFGSISATGAADGLPHLIVATMDWANSNTHEIWVDGLRKATGTITGAHVAKSIAGAKLFSRSLSAAYPTMSGTFGAAWSRVLSSNEIAQLYADPFCMLKGGSS